VHMIPPELQHTKIVVGLCMVIIVGKCQAETLKSQFHVTDALATYECNMPDIEPDVSLNYIILCQRHSPLEAGQGHIVLLGIETAQAQVVEQLCIRNCFLPVKFEGYFWLIRVKMVGGYAGNGFNMHAVRVQNLLVKFDSFIHLICSL
ncbi:hypothetical protein EGW08_019291, partial [Elysia chlorotica]